MRRPSAGAALVGVAAALAVAAPPALGAAYVKQLVVQRNGDARQKRVKADKTHVKVHGTRCAVPSDTALAALLRTDPPGLRLHDFGSCSGRASDAGGLFVRAIGGDANKGQNGWVYKVGHRLATAGAADPSGPFGNGRLKSNDRVTWFYCHLKQANHSCQRTLAEKLKARPNRVVHVHVTAYDDNGHGKPAAGATVHAGKLTRKTDKQGNADIALPPGEYKVYADKQGTTRSFGEAAASI